jgi:predicted aspartyl protease
MSMDDAKNRRLVDTGANNSSIEILTQRTSDELNLLNQDVKALYTNLLFNLELVDLAHLNENQTANQIISRRVAKRWIIIKEHLENNFSEIILKI